MAINLSIVSKFDDKGLKNMEGKLQGLGGSFTKLAGVAAGALASIGIGKFVRDSITAASDLDESLNAVSVAYGDAADAVLAIGENSALSLGVSQTAFNQAAVRFSAFAERVVGEGGDVAGFVGDISQRATDFASVFNIDVSEALQVFQSGLSGEAEPLKRFGINLLDSEVKAYALRAGIVDVGEAMTETEKVQARYGLLLESTAKTAGDFANTSDGMANSQRILQASFQNLTAEVGGSLTPVVATLFQALEPIAFELMPKLADFIETRVAPALQNIADRFREFSINVSEFGLSMDYLIGRLQDLMQKGLDKVVEFFQGDGLEKLLEAFANVRQSVIDAFIKIIPLVVNAIIEILPAIVDTLANMIPELLKAAVETFTALVDAIALVLPNLINAILKMLPKIVETIVSLLPDIIDAAIEAFDGIVQALVQVIPDVIEAFIDATPRIVDAIIDALPKILEAAFTLFTGIVTALIRATPEIVDALIDLVPKMVTGLLDQMPKLVNAGFQLLSGLVKGIVDNVPKLLGEAIGAIGNTLVNGVNKILGIRSPSRVFMGIGEDVVLGLEKGIKDSEGLLADASVDMASTVKLGAVSELSNLQAISPSIQSSSASQAPMQLNVTVNAGMGADGADIGRKIVEEILRFERSSGRVFVRA